MPFPLIAALATFVVLATLLPLSRSPRWWVRDLDFPRLQICAVGLAVVAVELFFLDLSAMASRVILIATGACTAYQLWWILPYTRLYPCQVKRAADRSPENRIRILTANVLMPNRNTDGLIALIRQHEPDIFVTLESNAWWQQRLDVLERDYPHSIKCPLENLYGMHVYSRLPLEECATRFLVQPDIPSMHAMAVLPSGQRVKIHFLHPMPPSPTENDESTERDAELVVVGKHVAGLDTPVIVTGDLNDVAWSPTTRLFLKISGLLDPRIGRGMFNTFHAGFWFMRWPLDHLFHSRHFTVSRIRRLPAFGSDHFPVLMELVHEPEAKAEQEGLPADSSDHALAEEKIEQARERASQA